MRLIVFSLAVCATAGISFAGPYTETGIAAADPRFKEWAATASVVRGPIDIANPSLGLAMNGDANSATGTPGGTFDVVSLGDGGSATVTFATPIGNGAGPDFAVFENGFATGDTIFGELAFVDVSSNGINFFRFPSRSLTQATSQVLGFGSIDSSDVYNLAGKHGVLTGTPFDLTDLVGVSPLLDVGRVTHVRVTDVVGIIDSPLGSVDSTGHAINDPYATPFDTGGFDLDAVGVINLVPEPTLIVTGVSAIGLVSGRRRARSNFLKTKGTPMKLNRFFAGAAVVIVSASSLHANVTVDFTDLTLPTNGHYAGDDPTHLGGFHSGGAHFEVGAYSGYAYSNVNDTTTPGFGNQFAAITGTGFGGSGIYGIGYDTGRITLPAGERPQSIKLTNTTYADLSLKTGDQFAKKFGGPDGTDPDYFTVTFTGYDAANIPTGTATFFLADFRAPISANDYIVETWTNFSLAPLGAARSIGISFDSSDKSFGFVNQPSYVAFDNLALVPEPTTLALLALPLAKRRRHR